MERVLTKHGSKSFKKIILVLNNHLSLNIASLKSQNKRDTCVLFIETFDQFSDINHHKKKLVFFMSAMRHFAEELKTNGWYVKYQFLENDENSQVLETEIKRVIRQTCASDLITVEANSWQLQQRILSIETDCGVKVTILNDDRFICSNIDFLDWSKDRKSMRLEFFYRYMRLRTGLLMNHDKPVGGKWNYDAENRKRFSHQVPVKGPKKFSPDKITRTVINLVKRKFDSHFGDLDPFWFATSRQEATESFEFFIAHSLKYFGEFQDAMVNDESFLFHSNIAMYLNVGLLDVRDVCIRVEHAYQNENIPLNSAEGFIRQLIGWREFVRGIYWREMPGYLENNFLQAERPLPSFYWSGETDLACMSATILQTKSESYAHHIQRLMITGNFAMLSSVAPREIHEWYLAVYSDAHEWVELPNTLGMSQFSDGGIMASKPYAASGNYIKKMSNYCVRCKFDVTKKIGDDACPFNSLYWDFIARKKGLLKNNPRMNLVFKVLEKVGADDVMTMRKQASKFLENI